MHTIAPVDDDDDDEAQAHAAPLDTDSITEQSPTADDAEVVAVLSELDAEAASRVVFNLLSKVKQRRRPVTTRQRSSFRAKVTKACQPTTNAASDNCVECGCSDPPAGKNRKHKVEWIQCDSCQYWYHMCCVATG